MIQRFKRFISEGENSLQSGIISHANRALDKLVKTAKGSESMTDIMKQILEILLEYDAVIVNDDNTKFTGRVLDSSGKGTFEIAPLSSENDRKEFIPFPGVKLHVSWAKSNGVFILNGCKIS